MTSFSASVRLTAGMLAFWSVSRKAPVFWGYPWQHPGNPMLRWGVLIDDIVRSTRGEIDDNEAP